MINEVWKFHERSGLVVSNYGRVVLPNGNITYGSYCKGHRRINISRYSQWYVHRLVLECFSPNPCPQVYKHCDHINELKDDNFILNLRWVTPTLNNLNCSTRKGFHFHKGHKLWEACLRTRTRTANPQVYLRKYFKTSYLARVAYVTVKPYAFRCEEDLAYQESLKYNFNPFWTMPEKMLV